MLTKTYSAALTGIEALPLEVEVNASGRGEQDFVSIVGLPDAAVRESRVPRSIPAVTIILPARRL